MTGLCPVDPMSFERWPSGRHRSLGGHPLSHPVDAGIDGEVIVATPDGTGAPGRVLIAVKATGRVTFCS